jgi:hypothetical protein
MPASTKKCISTCVQQTHPMPTRTQVTSQLVLTNPIPCQLGHKMYINLYLLNHSNTSELTKCTSTSFEESPPLNRGHKIYLNLLDQNTPMPGRNQNVSQYMLTKPLPCQRGHKIYFTMCRPIPSNANEDTNFILA